MENDTKFSNINCVQSRWRTRILCIEKFKRQESVPLADARGGCLAAENGMIPNLCFIFWTVISDEQLEISYIWKLLTSSPVDTNYSDGLLYRTTKLGATRIDLHIVCIVYRWTNI